MGNVLWKKIIYFLCMVAAITAGGGLTYSMPVYASQSTELTGTLSVMVNKTEAEMQPYKERFQSRYPGIELTYIPVENYETDAKAMIESGDYADVLFIPGSISSNTYSTYFEVLGNSTQLSQKYNFMEQSKRDGSKVYGIPSYAYVSGFLYNKAVFEKAGVTEIPKTIDEFLEALRCIKNYTDAVPFYTNYVSDWALNIWETYPFVDMTGNPDYKQNIFVNEANPYRTGSSHAEVYQLLYDIVREGLSEEIGTGDWEDSKSLLNSGQIGCIAIGSWALVQFKNAGDHPDDVAFMPFPNSVDGKQYSTITTDYCYGININSQNKAAARAYIDFMLNESGYALDNETLSIVKTDPYPDSYNEMTDVTFSYNYVPSSANNGKYEKLASKLNLSDGQEQKRIIDAAAGKTNETLEDIFDDWNTRWESSRTADMVTNNEIVTFSENEIATDQYTVNFSDEELAYLKDVSTLKVGYLRDFAPFQSERSGEFVGIARELCNIISEQTSINLEYTPYDNYTQLVEAVENDEIDFIAGIENIAAFTNRIRLSKGYADFTNVLVKSKSASVKGIDKKLASAVTGNESDYFQGLSNITYSSTFPESLNLVNRSKADYTITNYYSANYYIREKGYRNVTILPMTSKNNMYLGFQNTTDTRLIAICNKCIYSIPDSKIELLLLDNMEPPVSKISLRQFVETYPIPVILFIIAFFLIVIFILFWIYQIKEQSSQKHALDTKRYKILSDLADEYVFEYNCTKSRLIFDKKFQKTFNFGGEVNLRTYQKNNPGLNLFLSHFTELKDLDSMTSTKNFSYEHNNGQTIWYRLIVSKIFDEKHHMIQIIGKVTNIQKEMEERQAILNKAERDPLTGLFNRDGLYSVCNRLLETAPVDGHYAMAVLDLDDFKSVNDTLGHAGGDVALKVLANELNAVFEDKAILSRYGGDEFVIYIPDVRDTANIHKMLIRLVTSMDRVLTYQEKEQKLSISLGAVIVSNIEPLDNSFEHADRILYEVKKAGKNNYRLIKME